MIVLINFLQCKTRQSVCHHKMRLWQWNTKHVICFVNLVLLMGHPLLDGWLWREGDVTCELVNPNFAKFCFLHARHKPGQAYRSQFQIQFRFHCVLVRTFAFSKQRLVFAFRIRIRKFAWPFVYGKLLTEWTMLVGRKVLKLSFACKNHDFARAECELWIYLCCLTQIGH